ncbi:MAG: hypothetical protein NC225_08920 [Clostridium sp.]|nr:hypothetical protein [Clostridium sp.]MCM1399583.1 hypothetical protein [Clostridium sp.]MCM1460137.1 hypothetical protein [Bacteroides sp.]
MDNGSNGSFNFGQDQPAGGQQAYSQPQDMNQQVYSQPQGMNQQAYGQPQDMNQQVYSQPQDMNQQAYSQPQGMNQQIYNQPQAPMGGGNGGPGNPPKTKKPMSGGKLAGIILGGVAAVAAIVCGVIFIPRLLKTDKEVVIDAFNASFQQEVVEADTDDILGSKEIEKKLEENGGEISLALNLSEIDGATGTATVSVNEIYNPIDKLVNYTVNSVVESKDIFTFNLIGEQDNTYLEFVNLIDGYFMLPNDNMGGAINSSYFGELLRKEGITVPDVSVDYFQTTETSTAADSVSVNPSYVNAIEKLWDSTEYEKQGNAKIDVNGSTVKAKEYTVTMKEENIEEAITTVFDGVIQEAMADPSLLEDSGLTAEQYEATLNQVKAMVPSLVAGDFVLYVYVKDDKVVKCTSKDDISLYGVKFGYDFYMDLDEKNASGKFTFNVMDESVGVSFEVKDMKGNPNGKISVTVPDNNIDLTFTSTVESTNAAEKLNVDVNLTNNNETLMTINYNGEANKTDHSIKVTGTMTVPEDNSSMEFNMSGKFADIVKGTSYSMIFDDISMSIDGSAVLGMDAKVTVDTTNNAAVAHDKGKEVYEVATLTEDYFLNVILTDNVDLINDYFSSLDISTSDTTGQGSIDEEPSEEDDNLDAPKILRSGDTEVEILNSYAGTKCTYNSESYIYYSDDDYVVTIDYVLYNNWDAGELVEEGFYQAEPSGDGDIDEINVEKTLKDSSKVIYSYTKREESQPYVSAFIVKQIGEVCLAATVNVNGKVISSDELVEILADANLKVTQ